MLVASTLPPYAIAQSNMTAAEGALVKQFAGAALQRLPTAAGAVYCRAGACKVTPGVAALEAADEELHSSNHDIVLRIGGTVFRMECENGDAGIPGCTFAPLTSLHSSGSYSADALKVDGELVVVPGDGCMYSQQNAYADFRTTRKFCSNGALLSEVAQPFEYKGLKTVTVKSVDISEAPRRMKPFHRIPAHRFIEVILSTHPSEKENHAGKWYLVRDAVGITGWVAADTLNKNGTSIDCVMGPQAIKDLCFSGD